MSKTVRYARRIMAPVFFSISNAIVVKATATTKIKLIIFYVKHIIL